MASFLLVEMSISLIELLVYSGLRSALHSLFVRDGLIP
jgi:hypothetical protein